MNNFFMVSKTTEFELNKWELNCEIWSYKICRY
nr:MAG TPA: hypothetical protein [Caudoviricetes sp.]